MSQGYLVIAIIVGSMLLYLVAFLVNSIIQNWRKRR